MGQKHRAAGAAPPCTRLRSAPLPPRGVQGPSGASEQSQTRPGPFWPLRAVFCWFCPFLNQLKLNCLNSPRAPTKAASTSSGSTRPEQRGLFIAGSWPWLGAGRARGPRSVPVSPVAGAGGGSGARTLPQVPTSPAQPRDAQTPPAQPQPVRPLPPPHGGGKGLGGTGPSPRGHPRVAACTPGWGHPRDRLTQCVFCLRDLSCSYFIQ